MENITLFMASLGLVPPWQVISARVAGGANRLDIDIEYVHAKGHDCPLCGGKGTGSPTQTFLETWYHEDFFCYATYLHARVPVLFCSCGGTFRPERPWSRGGSRFCRITAPSR